MDLSSINLLVEESKKSSASELANAQLFICKLCEAMDLPAPEFAREHDSQNHYVFEKLVHFGALNGKARTGRIDLYKRGCFVLESKQSAQARRQVQVQGVQARKNGFRPAGAQDAGVQDLGAQDPGAQDLGNPATGAQEMRATGNGGRATRVAGQRDAGHKSWAVRRGTSAWRRAMIAARVQAEHYARALPDPPPFLIILDVGHMIELYADFSGRGAHYAHFPDPARHRIAMDDLRNPEIQRRLQAVWTNPDSLAGELQAPSSHGEDALAHYLLDRAIGRRGGPARSQANLSALLDIAGGRFAPCLGLREQGKACRILV